MRGSFKPYPVSYSPGERDTGWVRASFKPYPVSYSPGERDTGWVWASFKPYTVKKVEILKLWRANL